VSYIATSTHFYAQEFLGNLNILKYTQLEVGEALLSFLDAKGTPGVVERAYVCPPQAQIGPITSDGRAEA
jgi:hypothetical protein